MIRGTGRRARTMALIALASLGATACGVPGTSGAQRIDARDLPDGLRQPVTTTTTPPTTAPTPQLPVIVYFITNTTLQPWPDTVPSTDLDVVLSRLERGPTPAQARDGARSALTVTAPLLRSSVDGSTASIELDSAAFARIPAADQILALGQIVLTATAPRLAGGNKIRRVRLTVRGQPITVPRADGTLTKGPLTAKDYEPLLSTATKPRRSTGSTTTTPPRTTTTTRPRTPTTTAT